VPPNCNANKSSNISKSLFTDRSAKGASQKYISSHLLFKTRAGKKKQQVRTGIVHAFIMPLQFSSAISKFAADSFLYNL
jgi:hypothetical protein